MKEPKLIRGGLAVDDRGYLRFVNDFKFENIKRFYQIENHSENYIRAWHGHKIESKYFYVNKGAILIGAVNLDSGEVFKFTLTSESPAILYIPSGYANGFKNLTNSAIITVFSTTTLEESKNDDYRFPFDKWNIWEVEYR